MPKNMRVSLAPHLRRLRSGWQEAYRLHLELSIQDGRSHRRLRGGVERFEEMGTT